MELSPSSSSLSFGRKCSAPSLSSLSPVSWRCREEREGRRESASSGTLARGLWARERCRRGERPEKVL